MTFAPISLSLKEGETVDQVFAQRKKEGLQFFERARLPSKVPAFRDPPGFGETKLGSASAGAPRRIAR